MADTITISPDSCNALSIAPGGYYSKQDIVQIVDTIDTMIHLSSTIWSCSPLVFVTEQPRGGWFFIDDLKSGEVQDEGITFFPVQTGTGKIWRRVISTNKPWNPTWWGAEGDGIIDDSTPIQTMLSLIQDTGGYFIRFPAGYTFNLESSVEIPVGDGTNRIVRLEGYGSTILASGNAGLPRGALHYGNTDTPFDDTITSRFQVCGFKFEGIVSEDILDRKLLEWANSYFGRIQDCTFNNGGKALSVSLMMAGIIENIKINNFFTEAISVGQESNNFILRNFTIRNYFDSLIPSTNTVSNFMDLSQCGTVQVYNGVVEGDWAPNEFVFNLVGDNTSFMKNVTFKNIKVDLIPSNFESDFVIFNVYKWSGGILTIGNLNNKCENQGIFYVQQLGTSTGAGSVSILKISGQNRMPSNSYYRVFSDGSNPANAILTYVVFEDSISRSQPFPITGDYPFNDPALWYNGLVVASSKYESRN